MKDLIIRIILALMFIVTFAMASGALVWVVWNGIVNVIVDVPYLTYLNAIFAALIFDLITGVLAFGISPRFSMH